MNINRDYLIINDVKKSSITLDNGSMFFYITDKNTQNIFVNLVINVSNNDLIQKYANIENAEDYTLTMNIVKPSNTYKVVEGKLHNKEKAIFEFNLEEDCCDEIGTYRCELLTKCNINDHEEITTSNKLTYKVKSSVLNDLDDIVEAPEYPLVIQLFDKLSDINQYEEDRRANELARQLAEEQRQTRFDALDVDMTDSIQVIDNKVIDVENRVSSKEQAVDKLIVDTKADIDNYKVAKDQEIDEYKVAKDQEIDEYKAAKDAEINEAITNQDNKIDEAISNQNDRIALVENNDATQNARLDIIENKNTQQDNRLTTIEDKNVEQDNRLNTIEAIDVAQNTRLDAIEAKNTEQDDRLLDIEKVNKRQDMNLKCLFAESKNNMIDITEEGNSIYLQNSTTGYALIDEIKGNTLVNCNKEPDKELILNGNINTSGDNTVTITEGVDGGLVDVALEGNTLVNVSKTKDSTAISKAYTVENNGNHIALQGDIDGSCRPVITGNTLVNLITYSNLVTRPANTNAATYLGKADLKGGVTYTISYELVQTSTAADNGFGYYPNGATYWYGHNNTITTLNNTVGRKTYTFTLPEDKGGYCNFRWWTNGCSVDVIVKDFILLEGDYTDKPILDYFTGLQSTFEDNLVAQEMVDSGEEIADNLGKYKVDYKSTREDGTVGSTKTLYLNSPLLEGDTIEEKDGGIYHVHRYNKVVLDGSEDWKIRGDITKFTAFYIYKNGVLAQQNAYSDKLPVYNDIDAPTPHLCLSRWGGNHIFIDSNLKTIDELKQWLQQNPVTVVYKLASPQYELIEQSNLVIPSYANGHLDFNTAVPVEKVDFLPFIEELTYLYPATSYTVQFLSDRTTTADITLGGTSLLAQNIVKGLNKITITAPSELVDNKLVINGAGAKISEVVVTDTDREFEYFEGMKSVGEGEELEIACINNVVDNTQNKIADIRINTGEEIAHNKALISGFNLITNNINPNDVELFDKDLNRISPSRDWNAVTEQFYRKDKTYIGAVDDGTAYYVRYRCLKASSSTSLTPDDINNFIFADKNNPTIEVYQSNTQQLTHEPLRAVGDAKDRYVLIDGKWYIERNCGKTILDETINWTKVTSNVEEGYSRFYSETLYNDKKPDSFIISTPLPSSQKKYLYGDVFECIGGVSSNARFNLKFYGDLTNEDVKARLKSNPITVVYELATPTYEPIDYNPLEVYSDVTHITTNSVIPTNIIVKNHGFNCLLKPSTTYTISSNLGLNTVTTPAELTEDCLRFMDTDTSDVTTMKDVLVLEGDWTTKADLIPANFSGIQSCFEQELVTDEADEHYGKYKVNVKVANEDKTKENNITFYINEPLRGIGNIKDKVYVKDDKVVVQRNCCSLVVDSSLGVYKGNADYNSVNNVTFILGMNNIISSWLTPNNVLCSTLPSVGNKVWNGVYEGIASDGEKIMFCIARRKLQTQDVAGFKQWLQQNPTTVVYQLAEPVYEEIEYNDVKLFIESFKNSTLSYNSNVPVTSTVHYSYSVPIVDTVAKTASITDEQDSMIIDLATQCAVMEMMLM